MDARDGFQQEVDAFPRAEIGGVENNNFVPQAKLAAHLLARAAWRAWNEEIVDDVNRVIEIEHPLGLPLQRLRNRRDRVRIDQGVPDSRGIAWIISKQRRVRGAPNTCPALSPECRYRQRTDNR